MAELCASFEFRQVPSRKSDREARYDAWFDGPINNAKLAASGFYNDLVPDFERLFAVCSGSYPDFYAAVARLGALDRARRHEALKAAKSCG